MDEVVETSPTDVEVVDDDSLVVIIEDEDQEDEDYAFVNRRG